MNHYLQIFAYNLSGEKLPHTAANKGSLDTILSIIFIVIGGLSVLMIVIAGLRYIFAQGDPTAMAKAKNTILYAIIGLIISALAYSIVNFVLGKF
jgi:hypothetical protein